MSIIADVDLVVAEGAMIGLVGPNGSGKSTLLRAVYRALRPVAGVIDLGGDDVWRMSARQSARRTAVLTQRTPSDLALTAFEVVEMGRIPHGRSGDGGRRSDEDVAWEALERVGTADLAGRSFATLSGGEQQRVLLARALTQQPQLLVVDEPTNHLDVRYQHEVLDLIRSLGVTTLAALHDLNLASTYCDQVALLDRGRLRAVGAPTDVLTGALVSEVFGITAHPLVHPVTGAALFAFSPDVTPMEERRPPPATAAALEDSR